MQKRAFETHAHVVGVGGEAGGGKTDLAFGLALHRHREAILFRAEFAQMQNRIIRRGRELIDSNQIGHLTGGTNPRWEHVNGFLQLGALKYAGDYARYQGGQWSLMVFDEATNIRKDEVLAVMGWNRSAGSISVNCQTYMFFNPPSTPDGEWVIEYFAPWLDKNHPRPAKEGELRWFITVDGYSVEVPDHNPRVHHGKTVQPRSRTFFRSYLNENPDLRDTYPSVLASLPFPLNQQLLEGDFEVGLQTDAWQLFSNEAVAAAMQRWRETEKPRNTLLSALGCDVARGGRDQTIIAKRYNDWFAPLIKIPGSETPRGGDVALRIQQEHEGNAVINMDSLMVGASPYDSLVAAGLPIFGINFGEGSDYRDESGKYEMGNFRAEAHWRFAEGLEGRRGRTPIALPPDDELQRDLRSVRYYAQSGKIYVESKDEIRKRLGRSPDCGDTVILADLRGGDTEIMMSGERRTQLGRNR